MAHEKQVPFRESLLNAIMVALIAISASLSLTIVLSLFAIAYGSGQNQAISALDIQNVAYKGMPIETFCYELGLPVYDVDEDGRLQLSRTGFLSAFVAQHETVARFNKRGELVSVFQNIVCGVDENGMNIPLLGEPGSRP